MKTLFCSTLVLFLVACGGGSSSEADNTAKFSKAPPGEQAATLREMYNEFSKKCPDLKMGELTEDAANRYAKDCSSEELTKFHEILVCYQKTACDDTAALKICEEKSKDVSDKCLGKEGTNPQPPRPNPYPETPRQNHDHQSHEGHNHGPQAHDGHNHDDQAPADMPEMTEAMKNMFNNMGNAGQNQDHQSHDAHNAAADMPDFMRNAAPTPESGSDDAEGGQTPMMR
ncbi:MAG: hypothetical protein WCK42_01865 [Myxococcaceae bacterium]